MNEKTCSKCGFEYHESLCYRSNITGLIVCANCLADKRRDNILNLRYPRHKSPSQIIAREKQKEKYKREKKSII